ncbi:uncharacterized protein BDV17DRAFT_288156 [Aspergillus undulatus]|uniref:uncharacterized protein n=1 Tax=Aspergillus undulatus TaxID=1810928 RepID=UPI003CCCFCCB
MTELSWVERAAALKTGPSSSSSISISPPLPLSSHHSEEPTNPKRGTAADLSPCPDDNKTKSQTYSTANHSSPSRNSKQAQTDHQSTTTTPWRMAAASAATGTSTRGPTTRRPRRPTAPSTPCGFSSSSPREETSSARQSSKGKGRSLKVLDYGARGMSWMSKVEDGYPGVRITVVDPGCAWMYPTDITFFTDEPSDENEEKLVALRRWEKLVAEAAERFGKPINVSARHKGWMEEAGCTEVREEVF